MRGRSCNGTDVIPFETGFASLQPAMAVRREVSKDGYRRAPGAGPAGEPSSFLLERNGIPRLRPEPAQDRDVVSVRSVVLPQLFPTRRRGADTVRTTLVRPQESQRRPF